MRRAAQGLMLLAAVAGAAGAWPQEASAQAVGTPRPAASATGGGVLAARATSAARAVADRRLVEGLDAATYAAVRATVADAAVRTLPLEPLVAKALAGVEAGAPGPRVAGAVRALHDRLATASAALAPTVGDAEVVAGADALAVGVPPVVLRQLRRLSPGRSTAVPLGVVAQLVARGVPVPRAAAAVADLLKRGASSAQLVALDGAVRADMAAGVPATAALDAQARRVANGPLLAPLSPAPGAGIGAGAGTPTDINSPTMSGTSTRPTPPGPTLPRPRRP